MYLGVLFFMFLLMHVHWASLICEFMFSSNLEKLFEHILSSFWNLHHKYVILFDIVPYVTSSGVLWGQEGHLCVCFGYFLMICLQGNWSFLLQFLINCWFHPVYFHCIISNIVISHSKSMILVIFKIACIILFIMSNFLLSLEHMIYTDNSCFNILSVNFLIFVISGSFAK